MITVIRTFSVTTPIDQVVTYLADFANAQAWDPGTQTVDRSVPDRWRSAPPGTMCPRFVASRQS